MRARHALRIPAFAAIVVLAGVVAAEDETGANSGVAVTGFAVEPKKQ